MAEGVDGTGPGAPSAQPGSAEGSFFALHRNQLRLAPDLADRPSQLAGPSANTIVTGAAVAAARLGRPDRLVLLRVPIGLGGMGIVTLLPFVLGASHVIVTAPGALVCDQIADEFRELAELRRCGVCPESVPTPRIRICEDKATAVTQLAEPGGWEVLICTTEVAGQAFAVSAESSKVVDLAVVLAGHVRPTRWKAVLGVLASAPTVVLTSAPVAETVPRLPRRPDYELTVSQAHRDHLVRPVTMHCVGVQHHDPDEAIAHAAIELCSSPEHRAARSAILARARSDKHARELVDIYAHAGTRVDVLKASDSGSAVRALRQRLAEGQINGLVASGTLGEGLKEPRLAVVAAHAGGMVLNESAQILARRTAPGDLAGHIVTTATLAEGESGHLLASDPAWQQLLDGAATAARPAEQQSRQFSARFPAPGLDGLSAAAFRIPSNVQVFRLRRPGRAMWHLRTAVTRLGRGETVYDGVHADGRLKIVVTRHVDHPRWLTTTVLDAIRYELHAVVLSADQDFAFIASLNPDTANELRAQLGLDGSRVEPEWVDRLAHQLNASQYFALGMHNTRPGGRRSPAYQSYGGEQVGSAVRVTDAHRFVTSHAAARRTDAFGTGTLTAFGWSYRNAKVYTPKCLPPLEFLSWCDYLAGLVKQTSAEEAPSGAPGLTLASPRQIGEYPQDPYCAVISSHLYARGITLTIGGRDLELASLDLDVARRNATTLDLSINSSDTTVWEATLDTAGGLHCTTADLPIHDPDGEYSSLAHVLQNNPVVVYFADGSSTRGGVHHRPHTAPPPLETRFVTAWAFDGVCITCESGTPPDSLQNIQQYTIDTMRDQYPGAWIIIDDGSGEIADIIVVDPPRSPKAAARVILVHCKYSSKDFPGARVGDLYEVIGQACKSTRWMNAILWPELTRRLRSRASTKLAHGDRSRLMAHLSQWSHRTPFTQYEVRIVQPGFQVDKVNDERAALRLLSNARQWITDHDADFLFIGTPPANTSSAPGIT